MKRKRNRGFTLAEMMVGMFIMSMVVFFGTITLVSTLSAWEKGQSRIAAESEVGATLRHVRNQLREAMLVTVDGDGKGITYRLPVKEGDGQYRYPLTWDGVSRRFQLNSNGDFVKITGLTTQVLLKNVTTTDRRGGYDTGTYSPFVAGTGAITKTLTVQLVTKRTGRQSSENAYGRVREIVLLRNTPTLSQ
ncbi:MAG: prepilin-type N-terminal cleavage/methylation domain-containing protein [Fimbriimonadales bacterium]